MLQYSLIVPGLYCRGLVRRLGHNTKFCIVIVGWARWAQQVRRQAREALERTGRAGGRRWSARGEWAGGSRRAGRVAWLRAVHSVHSACFWPDLTLYIS